MTRKELYDAIVDGILYYVKKKDALYFNLPISEEETLVISPCSIYSPEQLIEHMYLGDVMDCICHYLVFTENNENNLNNIENGGSQTIHAQKVAKDLFTTPQIQPPKNAPQLNCFL